MEKLNFVFRDFEIETDNNIFKVEYPVLSKNVFDSTGMIYMPWVPTEQTVNKEYYVEVLREFRKRFLGEKPALFKSGQWHFHQDNCTSPQLHPFSQTI